MSNKVVTKLAASTFAVSLLAAPAAFAQSGSSTSGTSTPGSGSSSAQKAQTAKSSGSGAMQQSKVRDQLTKAGFQDVEILDASYLVRAQTSEGNTVLMVIDPPMSGASGQSSSSSSGSQKTKP
ncbi:hypothetical protein ACQKGC_08890 [Allorhizobium pseudoryzae]|uniref:hypothetical protein n=1 Tax=Allorhizobium pseudoryzae TaxID=379684 RepID=UPI003D0955D8